MNFLWNVVSHKLLPLLPLCLLHVLCLQPYTEVLLKKGVVGGVIENTHALPFCLECFYAVDIQCRKCRKHTFEDSKLVCDKGGFASVFFVGHSFPDTLLPLNSTVPPMATANSFTKSESFVVEWIFLHTSSRSHMSFPMWIRRSNIFTHYFWVIHLC